MVELVYKHEATKVMEKLMEDATDNNHNYMYGEPDFEETPHEAYTPWVSDQFERKLQVFAIILNSMGPDPDIVQALSYSKAVYNTLTT